MPSSNSKRTQSTRRKLRNAAIVLSVERKQQGITIRDICSKAGVSIGAFYHNYPSKEQLLIDAFKRFEVSIDISKLRLNTLTPTDAIIALFLHVSQQIIDHLGLALLDYTQTIVSSDYAQAAPPFRELHLQVRRQVEIAQLSGVLSDEYSAQDITEVLIQYLMGLMVDWCFHKGSYNFVEAVESKLRFLLSAFSTR